MLEKRGLTSAVVMETVEDLTCVRTEAAVGSYRALLAGEAQVAGRTYCTLSLQGWQNIEIGSMIILQK